MLFFYIQLACSQRVEKVIKYKIYFNVLYTFLTIVIQSVYFEISEDSSKYFIKRLKLLNFEFFKNFFKIV